MLEAAPHFADFGHDDRHPSMCDIGNEGSESAGINRQEAEDENSSRGRSSDPLGPEFCAVGREACREA
jgi:hypothetical protein